MIPGVLTETMNGGPSDDDDLVARLLAARSSGIDQEAEELFALLVHRHQRRVFKLILSILGPGRSSEAEDLTQEVFLKVYRRLDSFRSESRFSTWLYRVAYRRAIDLTRLARFHRIHADDEVLASLPIDEEAEPGPLRNTLTSQARIKLYAAVMALPKLQRSAVLLHYWMGEDLETIAHLLDRRPGTIKSLLFRARKRLARLLGKDGRELLT